MTILVVTAVCLAGSRSSFAQINVVTQHYDNSRTGQNVNESVLTPANVNPTQFGKLFSYAVDGQIFAQPLYMANVQIPNAGTHNVVYVATENDSVYAFDADNNGGSNSLPLWQDSLTSTAFGAAPGATSVPASDLVPDISPIYGITGTPVIDPVGGTLYVVSFTLEGTQYVLRLHALDITTGAEKLNGPVTIQASVPGNGSGSIGGVITFQPRYQNQRAGLLLQNGVLYIAFGSHGDDGPWHGWLLSYNASNLQQIGAFCTSPAGLGGGVWMAGTGIAAEVVDPINKPYGRMFFSTGNGDFTATTPYKTGMDYGDSLVNLDLTQGLFTVSDIFAPYNQLALDNSDGDLGSGGIVLLPPQQGPYPHLLVQMGKEGVIYLINRDKMGGYGTTDNIVQEIQNGAKNNGAGPSNWGPGLWGSPSYWNGNVYFGGSGVYGSAGAPMKAFSLTNGLLSAAPTSTTPQTFTYPGPTPTISSLGTTNGILWAAEGDQYSTRGQEVLWAYDATNLSNVFYSSNMNPSRDGLGIALKFPVPIVANGKVYVGSEGATDSTKGMLSVYGLLAGAPTVAAPIINPGTETFTTPISVTITDATPNANIYYTTDGSTPTVQSNLYTQPITVSATTTITAMATAAGYLQVPPVSATFSLTSQTASPVFSLPGGAYTGAQSLTITTPTPGAIIYYTTDGSTPTTSSLQFGTLPIAIGANQTVNAIAIAPGLLQSAQTSATYVIGPQYAINFIQGFSAALGSMQFSGNTELDDARLQLTDGGLNEASSAFTLQPVNIQQFTTDFTIQLSNPVADGMTFTIQNVGPGALGSRGAGLGYQGIKQSVAIKFDLHSNAGEGPNSTGLYINGAAPTVPAVNLTGTGIDLHSGDPLDVHMTYDGTTLTLTLTDVTTGVQWSTPFIINIPATIGSNTAYLGFTGGTGGSSASQKVLAWTYIIGPPTAQTTGGVPLPNFPTGFTGTGLKLNAATISGTSLQLADGGLNEARSAYFTSTVGVQTFTTVFDFQLTNAKADGFTFVIQNQGITAVGSRGGGLGYQNITNSVAVKFDIHNNLSEGNDSTGVFVNGASPTVPATDLTNSGIVLASGDVIHAQIAYNGTTLTLTLSDATNGATVTESYAVNIPQIVGANSAFVGFTGGTGGSSMVANILDWTYTTP